MKKKWLVQLVPLNTGFQCVKMAGKFNYIIAGEGLKNIHFFHEEKGGSAKGKREAFRQLRIDGE